MQVDNVHLRMQSRFACRLFATIEKVKLINKLQWGLNIVDYYSLKEHSESFFGEAPRSGASLFEDTLTHLRRMHVISIMEPASYNVVANWFNVAHETVFPYLNYVADTHGDSPRCIWPSSQFLKWQTETGSTATALINELVTTRQKILINHHDTKLGPQD